MELLSPSLFYAVNNKQTKMCVSLNVENFKGKNDSGPTKKKKKIRKKHFKERGADEKKPSPKPQQKTTPGPATQKVLGRTKPDGAKAKDLNRVAAQTTKGTVQSVN